jgi:hypothetical protein
MLRGNTAEFLVLPEEQTGNQETAENKEKINTDPSSAKPKL